MEHSPRFLKLVEGIRENIRELEVADVKRKVDRKETFHLVDVREESEFAADHLPGAKHLGRGILERDVEKAIPDLDAEIVLYCGGGFRSALACESVQKMGYTHLLSLAGGFSEWVARGGATEK